MSDQDRLRFKTAGVVIAYVSNNSVPRDRVGLLIEEVYNALSRLPTSSSVAFETQSQPVLTDEATAFVNRVRMGAIMRGSMTLH